MRNIELGEKDILTGSIYESAEESKYIPVLFDIAHSIQQLTCLLKPPSRSFCILIHAGVIGTNFIRGELECPGNLPDSNVVLETGPTGKHQQPVQDIRDKGDTRAKRWGNDGAGRHTQNLVSSAWNHPPMYPPETKPSSCPTSGEERHRP